MLNGFEDVTYDLTDDELAMVPVIAKGLERYVGKANAVTNADMCAGIERTKDVKITSPRMRKLIGYIRDKRIVKRLCASSNGYYIAATRDELKSYIESREQRQREIARGTRALGRDLSEWNT